MYPSCRSNSRNSKSKFITSLFSANNKNEKIPIEMESTRKKIVEKPILVFS